MTSTFFARAEQAHRESVERGEHDDRCEYLRVPRFHLCHCSKRAREAAGHAEPPGELEWRAPVCPRCAEAVGHDGDSWWCPRCCVQWKPDGTGAEFYDDYGDLDAYIEARMPRPVASLPGVVDVELPEETRP